MSTKTLVCGDRTYSFGTIPALEAVQVEIAIARVIGEPLFKAFMDAKESGESVDENAAVASAVGLILSNMKADELTATMETVFKYVSCDGKRVDINATFTGRNRELWQVFVAALRHNFQDFFDGGLFDSLRGKMGQK